MQLSIAGDGDTVVLTPTVDEAGRGEIPLHLSGAGLSEAALLATLLARDLDVLILDEPATNLSAAALRRVMYALQRRADGGSQTVLITHSSALVPTDVKAVVRLSSAAGTTVVRQLGRQSLLERHAELFAATPVRDALFAAGVVLTEGESEAAALRVWLSRITPTWEEAQVVRLDVGSESAQVTHKRL